MKLTSRTTTFLAAMMAVLGLGNAADYSSWARYRTVTVNTSAMSLGGAVTNIPLMVRFNATAHRDLLDSATQILAGGADIRVTKADGTTDVPFEIENATTGPTGRLAIWIKADNVAANSATAASFRVYWGKTGATTLSSPKAVFDSTQGYQAVFHMNELAGAGTPLADAVRGITTTTGGTDSNNVASLLGYSRTFGTQNGNVDNVSTGTQAYAYFNAPTGNPLNALTGPVTISAWTRSSVTSTGNRAAGEKHIVYNGGGLTGTNHVYLKRWGVSGTALGADAAAGGNRIVAGGDTAVANGGPYVGFGEGGATQDHWIFVTSVWDGTNWTTRKVKRWDSFDVTACGARATPTATCPGYAPVDSVKTTTKPGNGASIGTAGKSWFIGGWQPDGVGSNATVARRAWQGQLDEVRIENVVRSADYLRLRFEVERDTVTGATYPLTIGAAQIPGPTSPYGNWTGHKTIQLNTSASGANVPTDQINFPVLIRLGANEATTLSGAKSDGADIRFSKANDSTALPYEIESWSPTAAAIWVKLDTVKGNSTTQTIRMHWANSGAVSESNGANVFDTANGFVGVWHLGNTTGSNPRPASVVGAPNAIVRNMPGGYGPVAGIIGMADSLSGGGNGTNAANPGVDNVVSGTKPYIDIGRTSYTGFMNFTAGMSYSVWVNFNTTSTGGGFDRFLQMLGDDTTNATNGPGNSPNRLAFIRHSGNTGSMAIRYGNLVTGGNSATVAFPASTWKQYGFSKTPGNDSVYIYVDGVRVHAYAANGDLPVITRNNSSIGRSYDTANGYLAGKIDAPMMSKVPRSHAWMKLAYENQKAVNSLVNVGLPAVASVPGAPTTVSGVAGNAQVAVSWVAPASNGGAAITGYRAMVVGDSTAKFCTTTGAVTCTITGLTNGTGYTFYVRASNSAGSSALSGPSGTVTPVAPTTVPDAPTTVTGVAGAVNSGTIAVSWVAPTSTGGSAITGYRAMVVGDSTAKFCTTTGALTCNITALTPATDYTFYVRAANAIGSSALSTASAVVKSPTPILPGSFIISVGSFAKNYSFQLPEAVAKLTENMTMIISDAYGRTVWEKTIKPSENDLREISWNGMTSKGSKVSAGMYIVRVKTLSGGVMQEAIQQGVKLKQD